MKLIAHFMFGCTLMAAFLPVQPVQSESFESKIDRRVGRIAEHLHRGGYRTVAFEVEGLRGFSSTLKPKLREVAIVALTKHGVTVPIDGIAQVTVVARIVLPTSIEESEVLEYKIQFELRGPNDELVHFFRDNIDITVEGVEDVALTLGLPMEAPNQDGEPHEGLLGENEKNEAAKQLEDREANQVVDDQGVIRAIADGMFGLQILNGADRQPAHHDISENGYAIADLTGIDNYRVRLINDAPFDVLIQLEIDGLDSGWFTQRQRVLWYCEAGKFIEITGWLDESRRQANLFSVVPAEQSVAAQYGSMGNVGVIQANFFRAYDRNIDIAQTERIIPRGLGTGHGATVQFETRAVNKRPGNSRAIVTVRYQRQ